MEQAATQEKRDWPQGFSGASAWWMVTVTMVFQVSSLIDRQIISILIPEIRADLDLNTFQIFMIQGLAFALFYGAMGLYIGGLVDRYSPRRIMFAGITIWSLAAAATGLARNYWELFGARLAVGFGEGAISPASQSLISRIFPRHRMSTPMSCFTVSGTIGLALSYALGGFLLDYFTAHKMPIMGDLAPWRQVLITTGLPGLLLAFLAFTIRKPPKVVSKPEDASWSKFFDYLKENFALMGGMIVGLGLLAMMTQATMASAAAFSRDVLGESATETGSKLSLAIGVGGVVGGLAAGMLVDFFYRRGVRDIAFKALAISALVIAPLTAFAFIGDDSTLLLVTLTLMMITTGAAFGPGLAAIQMVSPGSMRGRFGALAVLASNLFGFAFGPMMVGAITDYVFGDPFRIGDAVAVTVLLLAPMAALLLWRVRKRFLAKLDIIAEP